MDPVLGVFVWTAYVISLYVLVYWFIVYFERAESMHREKVAKPRLRKYPFVSIVVPAYNEERTVRETLESVVKIDYPRAALEVLVIDDGSSDRTSAVVKSFLRENPGFPGRLIRKKNGGKASALNLALRRAKGEFFACLDADSFVTPSALKHELLMFERNPDLSVVTPVMKIHEPKTLVQRFQRLEYMGAMLLAKLLGYMDSNFVAPGPFSLYRTERLRSINGFDETSMIEDQEIVYRFQLRHEKIAQCPAAEVYTVAPSDFRQLKAQRTRWGKGTLLNLIKYRGMAFNHKYGDFGMFMMPLHLFGFFLAFLSVTVFTYYTFKPVYEHVKHLWLTNFDIVTYIKSMDFGLNPLSVEATMTFIVYAALALSFIFLILASRATNDRVRRHGGLSVILYFVAYYLVLSFITVKLTVEVLVGKKGAAWR
jgi:cellulose synthase/poly-beta-1,6-N-acetylglucosamine synthase-like glycosyltransferase